MILGLFLFVLFAILASTGIGAAVYAAGRPRVAPWAALLALLGFAALAVLVVLVLPS